MNPVRSTWSSPAPRPCWKIRMAAPNAAPEVSRFIRIAVNGRRNDRKANSSSSQEAASTAAMTMGMARVLSSVMSTICAGAPPTWTVNPAGASVFRASPRSRRTRSAVSLVSAACRGRTGTSTW